MREGSKAPGRVPLLLKRRTVTSEVYVYAFLFLVGPIPALLYFLSAGYTFFYQTMTPESALWACGHGLIHPREISAPFALFLSGGTATLGCDQLIPSLPTGPPGLFAKVQPYFTWSAALLWRAFGLNYKGLAPLIFILYGTYGCGCYAVARLFLGRALAFVAGAYLLIAPAAISMALTLRDFSKAPFFVCSIALLITAIRRKDFRGSIAFATLAATFVGIGYGFRSDSLTLLVFGALVLAVGARPKAGASLPLLRLSWAVVPAAFLLWGGVVSAPVWANIDLGRVAGTYAMQGATEPFRVASGLRPAGYAVGWIYSDEMTLSGVAATERLDDPNWDSREKAQPEVTGVSQAILRSSAHLGGWADLFVSDFLAQGMKSAGWVLGFPAFLGRAERISGPVIRPERLEPWSPVRMGLTVQAFLAHTWIVYLGMLGAAVLLWRVSLRSPREALCLFVLFGLLISYPGAQLSVRHVFHLEIVWVISLLSLAVSLPELWRRRRTLPRFAALCAAVVTMTAVLHRGAIEWQERALTAELDRLLALPRESVGGFQSVLPNGDRQYLVPVPETHRSLLEGGSDSMTPAIGLKGAEWDVRAAADRMLVHVSGAACPFDALKLNARYTRGPQTWQPFDTEVRLIQRPEGRSVTFLVPAFYRASQHLEGFVVPRGLEACNLTIERVLGRSRLPFVLVASLEGRRILGPGHKALGDFSVLPVDTGGVAHGR